MSDDRSLPHTGEPDAGESESVNAPHRDDQPPRRQKSGFVWLALLLVLALAVAGVLVALGFGVLSG
jgi:hypothetical protein